MCLLTASNFSVNKIYQKSAGDLTLAGSKFIALQGLFAFILFFIANGFKLSFSGYSFLISGLLNCLAASYTLIGFKILKSGTMAIYTLFLMSGGMVLPYIFGLIFLNEPFSVVRTFALVLLLVGVILPNFAKKDITSKQLVLCFAVFFINGCVSILSKIHQIDLGYQTINEMEFVAIGGAFKFVFSSAIYVLARRNNKNIIEHTTEKFRFSPYIIPLFSAVLTESSFFLQLHTASILPASILFPFMTGGTIVLSSLSGVIFFKDKLPKRVIISIVLCFIGTLFFL